LRDWTNVPLPVFEGGISAFDLCLSALLALSRLPLDFDSSPSLLQISDNQAYVTRIHNPTRNITPDGNNFGELMSLQKHAILQ
jgi:hypothetical protein